MNAIAGYNIIISRHKNLFLKKIKDYCSIRHIIPPSSATNQVYIIADVKTTSDQKNRLEEGRLLSKKQIDVYTENFKLCGFRMN